MIYVLLDERLKRRMIEANRDWPVCEFHDEWLSDDDLAYWRAWQWRGRLRHGMIWTIVVLLVIAGQPWGGFLAAVCLYWLVSPPKRLEF